MTAADAARHLHAFSKGLPGAHEDHPWGELVMKVDGKVFVFFGHPQDAPDQLAMSLKLPHTGGDALLGGHAKPTGYGLGKAGWVSFRFPADAVPSTEELTALVLESYHAVAKKRRIRELASQ